MSFNRTAVEDELYRIAKRAVDITWKIADQPGRPAEPFGTIKVTAHEELGQGDAEQLPNGDQITERMREHFHVDVSFQALGKDSMDLLAALKTYLRRPSAVLGRKNVLELGFLRAGDVRDLVDVGDSSYRGRAQMDAEFTVRFDDDLNIDTVASVEIASAYRTQTVEVP